MEITPSPALQWLPRVRVSCSIRNPEQNCTLWISSQAQLPLYHLGSHWCLYLLILPLKLLLWELTFHVLRLSGLGSHSLNSSPSLIMLFRINICRYCCIFLLNLSRQLHFKGASGNYYPALPTAAFFLHRTQLWCDKTQIKECSRVVFAFALTLHWASTWRKSSPVFGDPKAGFGGHKIIIQLSRQWFITAHGESEAKDRVPTGIWAEGAEGCCKI